MKAGTTIKGRLVVVGDELLLAYGRGTQRVRVREITSRGGVKFDRFNASRQSWEPSGSTVSQDDKRWLVQDVQGDSSS
jgi:hypothetical protein